MELLVAELVAELEDYNLSLKLPPFNFFFLFSFITLNSLAIVLDIKVRITSFRESSRLNLCLLEVGTSLSFLDYIHSINSRL